MNIDALEKNVRAILMTGLLVFLVLSCENRAENVEPGDAKQPDPPSPSLVRETQKPGSTAPAPQKWCTEEDAAAARAIDRSIDEATFGIDDTAKAERGEAAAVKRTARNLGLSVKDARDLYARAMNLCRSQLRDQTSTCTDDDIKIAKALRAAHETVPNRLSGEALLHARNEETKRVAKALDLGPSEAERVHDKTIEYCPGEVMSGGDM